MCLPCVDELPKTASGTSAIYWFCFMEFTSPILSEKGTNVVIDNINEKKHCQLIKKAIEVSSGGKK